MQYFSQDHASYLTDTTGLDASANWMPPHVWPGADTLFHIHQAHSSLTSAPLPAKVREFSAEVFKKVEKCKDEFLKSDDTEKTSRQEEDGKKPEPDNGYKGSADAYVMEEGPTVAGHVGCEDDSKVQIAMKEYVEAAAEEKDRNKVETELKREDQEQECELKGNNPELPRCNEGGDEEVAAQGETVIGKGSDEETEVSQGNGHCQGAKRIEFDRVEKVLKAMGMSVNNAGEAGFDEIDKTYPADLAKKAEGKPNGGKVGTEKEQEIKLFGHKEIDKANAKAVAEGNKDNTEELEGMRSADKNEVGKSKKFNIAEKEDTGTMEVSIEAVELIENGESKEKLNGAVEAKEVKLLEEAGEGLEKKEPEENNTEIEATEVVIASNDIIEKVKGEEKFTEGDDVEIKSDKTTKAQPKEEELEENGEHDASGNYKETEAFEIDNKKGEKCSIGAVWTNAVEPDWEEGKPKVEDLGIEIGHGHKDVEVKEEISTNGEKMEIKKDKMADQVQSQEIVPGEEKVLEIEAVEVSEFALEGKKEVAEDSFQDLDMEMQAKEVRSPNEANEEGGVNKGIIKQEERKGKKAEEKFMKSEEVQIVERVVNTTEESNGDFV
ncbi:hypothetical protein TcWFU_005510 [Taenia crassiceps]|uniref:Uncharacterized protein n=1 Tax=Taenia crassiceps TaxID=6207 RepID=A0ABR4QHM7_9CEST